MDNNAAAARMMNDGEGWGHGSASVAGQLLNPTNPLDVELLKMVVGHPPIREQLERVRDMLVEALAA
jgi:hypothetical protein